MGGGVEGDHGHDRLQTGDHSGTSAEGGKLVRTADSGAGRASLEAAECIQSPRT